MKIENIRRLKRKLDKLNEAQRGHISKAIRLNAEEGRRIVTTLAPDVTGETREGITTQYHAGGMIAEVVVIDSDASRAEKDRAYSIEHGRKQGDHGTTAGFHHVKTAEKYLGKKFKGRIRRALKKAAKEAANGT